MSQILNFYNLSICGMSQSFMSLFSLWLMIMMPLRWKNKRKFRIIFSPSPVAPTSSHKSRKFSLWFFLSLNFNYCLWIVSHTSGVFSRYLSSLWFFFFFFFFLSVRGIVRGVSINTVNEAPSMFKNERKVWGTA